jgi:hypothetical protein
MLQNKEGHLYLSPYIIEMIRVGENKMGRLCSMHWREWLHATGLAEKRKGN